jgi:hypothetical protein
MTEEIERVQDNRKRLIGQDNNAGRQPRKHIPMERFVVSVDGQRKRGYSEHNLAATEAERIKHAYPSVTVTIVDQGEEIIHPSLDKKVI